MSTRFSPDGLYHWDGQRWVSTLSPDGRFRWDGSAWVPVGQSYAPGGAYQQAARAPRVPTSWTRPLQYTVVAWYVIQALYSLSVPLWMGPFLSQAMNQSMQQSFERQQRLHPAATPPPAELTNAIVSMTTGFLWVGALFGLAICLLAIVGSLRRWTWVYYAVLVLSGFGILGLLNVVYTFTGPPMSTFSGFSVPVWFYWIGFLQSIPPTALFIIMLYALVKRGPWGMTRQQLPRAG